MVNVNYTRPLLITETKHAPEQPRATVAKPIGTAPKAPGLLREVIGLPKPLLTATKGARHPIPCAHFKWSRHAPFWMQYCQRARASWAWAGGGLLVRDRNECCYGFRLFRFARGDSPADQRGEPNPLFPTVPASQSAYVYQARICAHVSPIHTHPRLRTGKYIHVHCLLYSRSHQSIHPEDPEYCTAIVYSNDAATKKHSIPEKKTTVISLPRADINGKKTRPEKQARIAVVFICLFFVHRICNYDINNSLNNIAIWPAGRPVV